MTPRAFRLNSVVARPDGDIAPDEAAPVRDAQIELRQMFIAIALVVPPIGLPQSVVFLATMPARGT